VSALTIGVGKYSLACAVEAELSAVQYQESTDTDGKPYYKISYEIILLFGLVEMKAQIAYQEDVSSFFLWYSCLLQQLTVSFLAAGCRKAVRCSNQLRRIFTSSHFTKQWPRFCYF
jgi:hypothetical protein